MLYSSSSPRPERSPERTRPQSSSLPSVRQSFNGTRSSRVNSAQTRARPSTASPGGAGWQGGFSPSGLKGGNSDLNLPSSDAKHIQSMVRNKAPEELAFSVYSLKRQVAILQENLKVNETERRRLENSLSLARADISKAEELLYNRERTTSPNKSISAMYRNPDTSALVPALKDKIRRLQTEKKKFEDELTAAKGSVRVTKVNELQIELEAYREELVRQGQINSELLERLHIAEQQAAEAQAEAQAAVQAAKEYMKRADMPSTTVPTPVPSGSLSTREIKRTMEILKSAHSAVLSQAQQIRLQCPPGMSKKEMEEFCKRSPIKAGAPTVLLYLLSHMKRLNHELRGQPGSPNLGTYDVEGYSGVSVEVMADAFAELLEDLRVMTPEDFAEDETASLLEGIAELGTLVYWEVRRLLQTDEDEELEDGTPPRPPGRLEEIAEDKEEEEAAAKEEDTASQAPSSASASPSAASASPSKASTSSRLQTKALPGTPTGSAAGKPKPASLVPDTPSQTAPGTPTARSEAAATASPAPSTRSNTSPMSATEAAAAAAERAALAAESAAAAAAEAAAKASAARETAAKAAEAAAPESYKIVVKTADTDNSATQSNCIWLTLLGTDKTASEEMALDKQALGSTLAGSLPCFERGSVNTFFKEIPGGFGDVVSVDLRVEITEGVPRTNWGMAQVYVTNEATGKSWSSAAGSVTWVPPSRAFKQNVSMSPATGPPPSAAERPQEDDAKSTTATAPAEPEEEEEEEEEEVEEEQEPDDPETADLKEADAWFNNLDAEDEGAESSVVMPSVYNSPSQSPEQNIKGELKEEVMSEAGAVPPSEQSMNDLVEASSRFNFNP